MQLGQPQLFEQHITPDGFEDRTVTLADSTQTEVTAWDQAVSTALSSGVHTVHHKIFQYEVPDTSSIRILNTVKPRIKLNSSTPTELPGTTRILFGIEQSHEIFPSVIFSQAEYSRWRRVAIDSQTDSDKNRNLQLSFNNRIMRMFGGPYVDLGSKEKLVVIVTGTATLFDKDEATSVIEIDFGIKTR